MENMQRRTVSVPKWVQELTQANQHVNWSQVATAAFIETLAKMGLVPKSKTIELEREVEIAKLQKKIDDMRGDDKGRRKVRRSTKNQKRG